MVSSSSSLLVEIEQTIQKNSKEYEYFLIHSVRYGFILQQVSRIAENKKLRILDIGCFPYHIGHALEIMGHEVYGISSHHEPIRNKNIKVLNIETDTFPYEDNFFDLVLCNEVIEHLPHSPVHALYEIKRIVKKNGNVMITTPNIARLINRVKLCMGYSVMYPVDVYFEEEGKGNNIYHRHNREYVLSELVTLLQKTGWQVEEKDWFISYTPQRKRFVPDSFIVKLVKWINYTIMFYLPFSRDTLFVLGRK